MTNRESRLQQARRHVAEGEQRVLREKTFIAKLACDGHDTAAALSLLETLERTLAVMRERLAEERQALGRP